MPLSGDPAKRAAQFANLVPGANRTRGSERRGGRPKGSARVGGTPRGYVAPRAHRCSCRLCGRAFTAASANAAWCGGACKNEARRLERILAGQDPKFATLADRIAGARNGAFARILAAARARSR